MENDKERRKQARAARREKQRQQNAGRAEKMHQARMEDTAGHEASILEEGAYVGCSGWFYWHWRGKFYPENSYPNLWFDHYKTHFSTVELNAPFYAWPTVSTVKSWIRQTGDTPFIYTVKVSELITHTRQFAEVKTLIEDFGYIADLLGPYMGCFLFQLPPSFHYTPARLESILSQLDHNRKNVVEFRHASWWNDEVYAAFKKIGTIFCACSGPKLPEELVKTADDIYVRFHGTSRWYRHEYTEQDMQHWAEKIRASGAKRAWIYFNNDFDAFAIKNAKQLMVALNDRSKQ